MSEVISVLLGRSICHHSGLVLVPGTRTCLFETHAGAVPAAPNPLRAMEDLRWRSATIIVTVIAGLEFVALAGAGVAIFGNPLAGHLDTGTAKAAAPSKLPVSRPLPTKPTLARADTGVMVL